MRANIKHQSSASRDNQTQSGAPTLNQRVRGPLEKAAAYFAKVSE